MHLLRNLIFIFSSDNMASDEYSLKWFWEHLQSNESTVNFLQNHGIIPKEKLCQKHHPMTIDYKRSSWRCHKGRCREEVNLRKNTWLEGSTLPMNKIIEFIYAWTKEYTSIKFCRDELGISHDAVVDYNNYLREVCAHEILNNPVKIGGPNCTVEIDETVYAKRKYNKGRMLKEQWVFGGVCKETRDVFLYAVERRDRSTLESCIKEIILPGSTIVSDMWKAYEKIEDISGYNFKHLTVNHSENFVDPITGAHTQQIESTWNLLKRRNKRHCGTKREMMDGYLCEFIWRRRHEGQDLFKVVLENISKF
ncbi:uncharacterized protein LOC126983150 [Eriocheir sinensis]|uniref:uncharacterized protein LOC126983150 n=1 Tax=Eriocheir sinensis TaxID=95602 RepID=UPI0021CA05D1|nr:uncharacterized protein LOC126983150 [Eriocheir sinensis]